MLNTGKQALVPYGSLISFVNETITDHNWQTMLDSLYRSSTQQKGFMPSFHIRSEVTQNDLRKVQSELRADLAQLTDPQRQEKRDQDRGFLWKKINDMRITAQMLLQVHTEDPLTTIGGSVSLTERVSLLLELQRISDLVYHQLAELWVNGLLPRLSRCVNRKCRKFFLAKTQRKTGTAYCSERCRYGKGAAARTKASRSRRAAWGSIRQNLERAMEQMRTLHQTTERKALAQGEATLQKAEQTFQEAYPHSKGPGYEEGLELLAQANRRAKQLRKRVKGY